MALSTTSEVILGSLALAENSQILHRIKKKKRNTIVVSDLRFRDEFKPITYEIKFALGKKPS